MSIRQGQTIIAGSAPVKSIPIIGEIKKVCGTSNYIPEGCVLCNGTEFRGDQFSDLWTNFLTSTPAKLNVCSYAEYDNQVNTYGFCNSFAVDTIHQTFKVPTRNSYRKLVKKYVNGSDWYNLYDDGWIEQGGYTGVAGTTTITYKVPYSNNNYTITLGLISTYSGSGQTLENTGIKTKSESNFTLYSDANTSKWWKASGYTSVPNTTVNIDREFVCIVNGFVNQSSFDWGTWQNGLNSKLNVNLSNSKNITNCITEIPQDIKLELNNGVLTLKAGSKVYVPNGFESDGTTPKFDTIITTSDVSSSGYSTLTCMFFYSIENNTIILRNINDCVSGSTPGRTDYYNFYNTSTNKLISYGQSSIFEFNSSFPICICNSVNGQITSIDQVFNGFGYIGSTVFTLPGVKGLIPNGRKADGTLNNTEFTTSSVLTVTIPSNYTFVNLSAFIYQSGHINIIDNTYYDYVESDNKNYERYNGNQHYSFVIATLSCTNGTVSNFKQKTLFHSLNYSDKNMIAGFAMPSGNYITLTTGSSGSTYTAPANGWFCLGGTSTSSGGNLALNGSGGMCCQSLTGINSNWGVRTSLPVKKGDTVSIELNSVTVSYFRFVYAEGEQ